MHVCVCVRACVRAYMPVCARVCRVYVLRVYDCMHVRVREIRQTTVVVEEKQSARKSRIYNTMST